MDEAGWLRALRAHLLEPPAPVAYGDARRLLALYDATIVDGLIQGCAAGYRSCPPPHLEVRMHWIPLSTILRPWRQFANTSRIWSHTGILFEAPTIGAEVGLPDGSVPPKGFGYGLLHAYRDGAFLPMQDFFVELTRLGITPESIERLL